MFKKRRVNPLRAAKKSANAGVEPEPEHRLVAQMVMRYGFHCVVNMRSFAQSLDRKFRDWCYETVLRKSVMVVSVADQWPESCAHASIPGAIIRKDVYDLHPQRWFHVDHLVITKRSPEGVPLNPHPPHHIWASVVVSYQNEPVLARQLSFLKDGTTSEDIIRVPHPMWVDASLNKPERYHFIVRMKIQ